MDEKRTFYEHSKFNFHFYRQNLSTTHFHSHVELKFVLEGSIEASVGSDKYILSEGMGVIVFPYELHSYRGIDGDRVSLIQLIPDSENVCSTIFRTKRPVTPVFELPKDDPIMQMFMSISEFFKTTPKSPLKNAAMKSFAEGIISAILDRVELRDASSTINERSAEKIIGYCSERFCEPITISRVAKELFISERQISRILSEQCGTRFCRFINSMRVQLAIDSLTSSTKNISDIAYECGFESLCTFNRVFREIVGSTPSEIRRNNKTS